MASKVITDRIEVERMTIDVFINDCRFVDYFDLRKMRQEGAFKIAFSYRTKKLDSVLVDEIISDEGLYFLIEQDNYFLILRQVQGSEHLISIKRFYYGDYGDDRDYALLCAKELLDELKKEI